MKPGYTVYLADNSTVRADSMEHEKGDAWQADDGSQWIVTEEPIKIMTEFGYEWGHQVREATANEIEQIEREKAAWEAKSKERRLDDMLDLFPDF